MNNDLKTTYKLCIIILTLFLIDLFVVDVLIDIIDKKSIFLNNLIENILKSKKHTENNNISEDKNNIVSYYNTLNYFIFIKK